MNENKIMGIVCYIFPFVPYFIPEKSEFVRYHSIQGMNLFLFYIFYSFIYHLLISIIKIPISCSSLYNHSATCYITPWWISFPLGLVSLFLLSLAIIGIINVLNNKTDELPVINKIKIFK